MKRKDLLWFLAYPAYQIINTFRHEASHALAAMAEGAEVTEFVFWPTFRNGSFIWGYVNWSGSTTWFTTAAPYFCDMLVFFVALLIVLEARPNRRWLWINILVIGMLWPLINSAYNYSGGLAGGSNDVGRLLQVLDPVAVHLYFALTMLLYAWGIYHCYFRKKTWHPE
ncbi:MAG: M50 family metallopeptidase [Dehalococcoidia bacterium]|nr:M50 family metallopeptidase [Dehalococcoidia bacterium]